MSRAFHTDRLAPFCAALAALCGKDMVLPMNSGAEAVESGIKVARKWGTDVKGVPVDHSNIVFAHNNFHGRTTTVISFSDDEAARRGFGPYTPGFRAAPFGAGARATRLSRAVGGQCFMAPRSTAIWLPDSVFEPSPASHATTSATSSGSMKPCSPLFSSSTG